MKVFISGISGTLGTSLARYHHQQGDTVVGVSRSESKIVQWLQDNPEVAEVFSCDVDDLVDSRRDESYLLAHSDRCYHCAALKHVDICERQIAEAVDQNIRRTGQLACLCQSLQLPLIFISSDKACCADNVYGATKLIAEREVLQRGGAVVRLGNLIGSSGSVFAKWAQAVKQGQPIQVTDPLMTRLFIPVEEAAIFVATNHLQEQLVAPRMKSACMGKVARYIIDQLGQKTSIQIIGSRPGETRHQYLFPPESRVMVDEQNNRFVLSNHGTYFPNGISSANAPQWDVQELLQAAGVLS
jgi:FlaA1/EpsC-like NDP-sugar epimerase